MKLKIVGKYTAIMLQAVMNHVNNDENKIIPYFLFLAGVMINQKPTRLHCCTSIRLLRTFSEDDGDRKRATRTAVSIFGSECALIQ